MKKSVLWVLLCYILWGLLPIFWKLLNALNPVYILCSRIVWALVFCFVILICKRELSVIKSLIKNPGLFIYLALCGVFLTINWGSYIWAVNTNHVLDASLAYFINPIISVILGFLLYKERLTALQRLSVAIAFIGIMIPIIKEGAFPWLALIIGGSFSVYSAAKKKVDISSESSNFIETLAIAPFALIVILLFEAKGMGAVGKLRGIEYILLPLSGVVTSVPLLFFSAGIKYIPMSLSGILMYINPTLQFLVGVLIYKESLTVTNIITFAFVWLSLVIFVISSVKSQKDGI